MKTYVSMLVILFAASAPLLRAQNPAEPPKAVKISLHPMAEPRPALKYGLLPSVLDCRPGNAAVLWNRLPAERTAYFYDLGKKMETILEWMEIPLNDPREKEFRAKHREIADTVPSGSMFADMARAAQFESCDWQLPIHEGNVIQILLPDLNQLRNFGRLLAAKARLEIAEGKYDQAVETLQTGLALARHAAKGPTLIHGLVGAVIAGQSIMAGQIEQFIQRPDAPNIYWALSALPRPLIDFRPGFEGESNLLFLQFPELRDLEKKDMSPEEWRKLLAKMFNCLKDFNGRPVPQSSAEEIAIALQGYPMAKQYLIEHGRSAADVEAMPVAKVILIYSVEVYRELSDESYKAMFLPYAEGRKWLSQGVRSLKGAAQREIFPFASLLVSAVNAVKVAETRVEWTYARLRILEALRIYAAAHDGNLPDELEDIKEVPIPRNPFDDKPFFYHRDGNRAVLDCQDGPPGLPWRYEIFMLNKGEKP